MKNSTLRLIALALVATCTCASAAPLRIVACEAQVPSKKRGVCENSLSAQDFRALAPGVSWYYNWHFKADNIPPAGVDMTFIPMAWGNRPGDVSGVASYLAGAQKKPPVVLAINEPNLKGQAFIDPETTAELFKKIKAVADRYNVPVAGPNMSLGSAEGDSIKAVDPLTHEKTTYTFMIPFLKAFFHYMGATKVDAVAYHSYGNIGELKWATGEMAKQFGRPVWVTEYAQWNVPSVEAARDYLIEATDFLERSPDVQGYAWFKERAKDNPKISLLDRQPGKLSILGEAYVNLPPHDADIYYRLPGKLNASKFVRASGMDIKTTKDKEGFFDLAVSGNGGSADYNIQVDAAGPCTVRVRAAGEGTINLQSGGKTLGTAQLAKKTGWQDVEAKVQFAAGPQTLRVTTQGLVLRIHSVEFAK